MTDTDFVLVGGQYDGQRGSLVGTPSLITVDDLPYVRLNNPDTGAYLGGYVYIGGLPQ